MSLGSRRGRALAPVLLAMAVAAASTACGPTPPSGEASPSGSSPAPASASPAASLPPTASPTAPDGSGAVEPPPSQAVGVIVDPGLLEVLPAQVDGVALLPDPVTAAGVAGDPLLAASALSIAVALVVAPGPSDSADLAVASVVRLRPDVFDEAFYQAWRDTYNQAACEVADGVQSQAEARIGGRATHVGTCVGGAQTYHAYLEDQGFIVSVTATGPRQFGELILADLQG